MSEVQAPVSGLADYQYGFSYPDQSVFPHRKRIVRGRGSGHQRTEERTRLDARIPASFPVRAFYRKSMPNWGGDIGDINFDEIYYYAKPSDEQVKSWKDLPPDILATYDRLGLPEAEKNFLAGVGAQYDSEVVYHSIQKELSDQGVLFLSPEMAVAEYPDLVRKYFGTIIPFNDNKFAALNSAVWSGGSFIYVPPGVKVEVPLQAYFRINSENFGQFERTLIIADEGSFVHYIEGCTAPVYTTDSLHSAVVEIVAGKGCPRALLHDSELVGRRVQSRYKTRHCERRRHCGMGGRKYRFKTNNEVSGCLPDGRRCPWRGSFHRVRRKGSGTGYRWKDCPQRVEHHQCN